MIQVSASWSEVWTAAEAEKELIDFVFNGPGWYLTEKDTMLVVPVVDAIDNTIWRKFWPDDTKFTFYVWNCPFGETVFGLLETVPCRDDLR